MNYNRLREATIGLIGLAVIVVIVALIVSASGSRNLTLTGNNTATINAGGRLSLMWMGKLFYTVVRDGDEVVVSDIMSVRRKLCGVGCTVEVPIGSSKLKVTENNDGSLTITWPKYYHMY
jgi:hypothetical protein